MTEQQQKALQSLSRAFKKCKLAGLGFVGMCGDICYADIETRTIDLEEVGYSEVAQMAQVDDGTSGTVETHGAYIDSGGW